MTPSNPPVPGTHVRAESRQLLLLAICSVALVVAAFAAPAATGGPSPPDLPISDLVDGEEGNETSCVVSLDRTPVPDTRVTVTVLRDGEPVTDARVWFNDQRIGRTNQSGEVDGRVPYVRELEVTVGLPSGGECTFDAGPVANPGGAQSRSASLDGENAGIALQPATAGPAGTAATSAAQEEANATGTYAVFGDINIRVDGQTDPGTEVTVVATIDGRPVPDATVTVDGRDVGTTDADGRLPVRVPDDGSETMRVRVERGEIRSERYVPIRLLQVSVRGDGLFPLPGQNATAVATLGREPVGDAVVNVAGERVGTTNAFGTVTFQLPPNPAATVEVTTGDRTASVRVLGAYAPTIVATLVALVAFVLVPLGVFWAGGRRAIAALAVVVALLLAAVGGYAVAGGEGMAVATLAAGLCALVVAAILRPEAAGDAVRSVGGNLSGAGEWLTEQTLWVAGAIERFLDQLHGRWQSLWKRLRDGDHDLPGTVRSWVAGLPGRLAALFRYVVGAPRRLVNWLRSDSGPSGDEREPTRESRPDVSGSTPTIRQLWRTFASRVVPERWPQRTPGEVSREAVDSGFPRGPVAELTDVFRDVEYGNLALSDERYERARAAFDALEDADTNADGVRDVDGRDNVDDGRQADGGHSTDGGRDGDREVTRS